MQAPAEFDWQFVGLVVFVECDCLTDRVYNNFARVATCQVFFKLLANGRVNGPVHVFVQQSQQVVTSHFVKSK